MVCMGEGIGAMPLQFHHYYGYSIGSSTENTYIATFHSQAPTWLVMWAHHAVDYTSPRPHY